MSTKPLRSGLATLVAGLALLGASCGGVATSDGVASLSDPADAVTGSETAEAQELTREEALLAFTACLREHGVDIEDPTVDANGNVQLSRPGGGPGGGAGRDVDEARAARDACAPLLEDSAIGFDRADRTELEDALYEFAACMRDNGHDMPDPDFTDFGAGTGGGGGPFGEIDRDDPVFQEATAACEDVLAGFERPGGGPRGGGGNG